MSFSFPSDFDANYDTAGTTPISATSSVTSEGTLVPSMNDAANATAANTDPTKMLNGWQQQAQLQNGLQNGFGGANGMMMNGAGSQPQQQFQPGQFSGQQQQQGFRQPGMPGQQQHFNGQPQQALMGSQFASLSHPGAMPNLRPGPNPGMGQMGAGQQQQQPQRQQQGMGTGPTELQMMQNKALQQHYQRMLQQGPNGSNGAPNAGAPGQQQTPNPGQQPQQPANLSQNLTPYQQQQVMLHYQQQQREQREQHQAMLAQRQAMVMAQHQAQQGQQPLAPQHSGQQQQPGQFQAPLAPQNTGGSQHSGMVQPQHSGQQNGMQGVNGVGGSMPGGVNPAMLFQQAQFKQQQQQQQQQQQGMMNGLNQIGRPGTAMGGSINPALMYNNPNMQQMLHQQQLRQQHFGLQQQQQSNQPGQGQQSQPQPDGVHQQQPPVPPSPALSAASQSQRMGAPPPHMQQPQQHSTPQTGGAASMPPPSMHPPLQRAQSVLSHGPVDSSSPHTTIQNVRAMTQTPTSMSPPGGNQQQGSSHPTPVTNQTALPGQSDMSRPMSRMSSSGGHQQNQMPQGWNGPQNGMSNGSVDPRALSRMGQQPQQIPPPQQQPPQQQQQPPQQQQQQPGMMQRQQSLGGFGPASAAMLQGQIPGGPNAHLQQQYLLHQQQQQALQQQQQRPSTPHQPGGHLQHRHSQDQMHQQLPGQSPVVQSTPRMGAMPPPIGLPGYGVPSAPSSVRADSMPPQTPVSASMPGAPGMMNPAANAQMAMVQQAHAARVQQQQQQQQQQQSHPAGPNQVPQQRPMPTQLPTVKEVLAQLNPAQQQQLMNMPPPQQREQIAQLQMKLMQARQAQAQAQAHAQSAQAQAPMQAGPQGANIPPGVAPVGMPGAPQNAIAAPGRPVLPGQVPPGQAAPALQPVPPQARPAPTGPQIPPQLVGKVDHRMVVVNHLPFIKDEDDVTHGGQLPELDDAEIIRIQRWVQKDKEYLQVVDDTDQARRARTMEEVRSAIGKTRWFEMDEHTPAPPPGQKLTILWPEHKRKLRRQQTGRAETRYPLEYKKEQTDVPEELVPIRLEIEYESFRFRDTLVWNLNDPVATAERFAQLTIEDFQLPAPMAPLITKQIQEQLTEHKAVDLPDAMNITVDKEEIFQGKLEDGDDVWWEGWRKRLRTGNEGQFVRRGQSDDEGELKRKSTPPPVKQEVDDEDAFKPIDVGSLPPPPDLKNNPEIRVMIKLDILIGPRHLTDQFEWDIMETTNSPELFAETYASELSLGGEFKSAIAHDIREQVNMYQRALVAIGHNFDGGTIFDDDLRQAILPPVSIAGRTADQAANCMPILNNLSEGEMEGNEKEREKELKRKKRQGRARRGAIMSEREPLKTHRTLPGCADVGTLLPTPVAISVPSRRQAAVNASQTIASLVAQENNGGYVPALSTPTRDSHHLAPPGANAGPSRASKRQKIGHVNPPPLPESVYKPRAKMSPTYAPPSTGVAPPPKSAEQIRADNEARENEQAKPEWHCSTCGCPESIAVGRRKGPKGDKSQCGPCGKFYHRYRRTKDVVYNEDPEYHLRLRQAEVDKRKRKRPVKPGRKSALEDAADFTPDVNSPAHVDDDDDDDDDDDGPPLSQAQNRAASPPRKKAKTPDSSPSPPLAAGRIAEKEKEREKPATPPKAATPPPTPPPPPPPTVVVQPPPPTPPNAVPNVPPFNPETPQWMRRAMQELQARYEHDRFGAIIRPPQPGAVGGAPREWRIKCYDCPGKVYTPGPEETLQNFEVHLKNKRHRENVNARLGNAATPTSGGPPPAG